MIVLCPFCGANLPRPVVRGLASCNNCNRVFESSPFNRLLTAAWLVRRRHIEHQDVLVQKLGYHPDEADLVLEHVAQGACTHEEFFRVLKERGVSEDYEALDLAS